MKADIPKEQIVYFGLTRLETKKNRSIFFSDTEKGVRYNVADYFKRNPRFEITNLSLSFDEKDQLGKYCAIVQFKDPSIRGSEINVYKTIKLIHNRIAMNEDEFHNGRKVGESIYPADLQEPIQELLIPPYGHFGSKYKFINNQN